jgi:hypothetical protein
MRQRRENGILRFLNTATDPGKLIDLCFQKTHVRIPLEQAEYILGLRSKLPGKKYSSIGQIEILCGLSRDIVERLERPPDFESHTPIKSYPVLLLPIRLETRFVENELYVRIYPDKISIETHEHRLTESEFKMGAYDREIRETGSEEEKHEAWRGLVDLFGPRRAAWIRRTDLELPRGVTPKGKGKSWTEAPQLRSFPERFAVYLYRGTNLVKGPVCGNQIPGSLPIFSSPETPLPSLFDESSDWVVDFEKAVACGMALRIPFADDEMALNREKGFSRIIAVGIRAIEPEAGRQRLEDLIDNHHYTTGGLAFIEHGTPTNNTQEAKAGNPKNDPSSDANYRTEVEGPPRWDSPPRIPETNAQRLGYALGLGMQPEALRYSAGASDMRDSYSKDMRAALWPATGGYFLRTMLPGVIDPVGLEKLSEHFILYVDAGGLLPTIRAGDQPYGILPVSTIFSRGTTKAELLEGLDPAQEQFPGKASFDDKLMFFLRKMAVKWLNYAQNPELVPRINTTDDPDKELLHLLAMEPVSITYQARPFVDERFLSFLLVVLRHFAFGSYTPFDTAMPSPLYWVQQWAKIYDEKRRETAAVLKGLSDGGTVLRARCPIPKAWIPRISRWHTCAACVTGCRQAQRRCLAIYCSVPFGLRRGLRVYRRPSAVWQPPLHWSFLTPSQAMNKSCTG